jgi:hypothetical protein
MESALFYLTVGEGKLAEAKREFQEVLRFDRNNRNARKYLSRLEAFSTFHNQPLGFWKKKLGQGMSLSLVFITMFVLIFAVAAIFTTKSSLPPPPAENKSDSLVAQIPIQPESPPVSSGEAKPIQPTPNATKKPAPALPQKKESVVEHLEEQPAVTPQTEFLPIQTASLSLLDKPMADTAVSLYNYDYPEQELERFGSLRIITTKPVKLEIDDVSYGWTNGPAIKLAPGRHLIEVVKSDNKKISKRVFLKNGEILSIEFPDS